MEMGKNWGLLGWSFTFKH